MSRAGGSPPACKRCSKPGAKQLLSAPRFSFEHRPDAPSPQNTGASSIDHDVDVVIGRSAAANLREFERRQDYKRGVIAAYGVSGEYLSRLDNGEYFVMSEAERRAAKRGRLVDQEARERLKAWKARRSSIQGVS